MNLGKRLLKSDPVVLALADVAALYIRLVLWTGRLVREVAPESEGVVDGRTQAVIAFWHARMLLLPALKPPGRAADVLISRHRDGRLISEVIRRFGIGTVSGSSSRGALAGVRGVLEKLSLGGNISITPDGPRGPARHAAPGIAHVALKSGLPVIPVAVMAKFHLRLRSWDRFMIPLPFSKMSLVVGAPVEVTGEDTEAYRRAVESALNEATDRADALLGLAPESPDPTRKR